MRQSTFSFKARLEHIDGAGGWWYVRVPKDIRTALKPLEISGFALVDATIGSSTWRTSTLPFDDDTSMLPLTAEIRKAEKLELGKVVHIELAPREKE